jgi:hypothetical protein
VTEESQNERVSDAAEIGEHTATVAVASRESVGGSPQLEPNNLGKRWKRRVLLVAGLSVALAAGLVLPPLVNISRYQRQITALMTRSMGRPVRMSAVELRLLPSPGFILHDLSVSEDPAFGAEPILSARTVVASVRLFSLWRGRLEISEVSVDEASLNLVRSPEGRWNLESLLMGAQPADHDHPYGAANAEAKIARISAHFPYLSATNSRVNFKNGVEKTPFSLAGTDLSFWQDNPGQWRVRLLGQPVRTDLPMSLADTGEVRMEASLQSAAQLHHMPMKVQIEWRDAQLGQLSRLILGSDAGWRGDLTADIEMQGTLESAQTKARLRATGVRRQEFVPEISLDFDANCAFRYQHSLVAFHDIGCDTAIGDGRLHLKAELPGQTPGHAPEAMLEVHQVPLQAALDLLRTVRSGFAPGILARGTANGSLRYKESEPAQLAQAAPSRAIIHLRKTSGKLQPGPSSNLQGSLKITGAELSGGALQTPLKLPEITLTPAVIRQVAAVGGSGNLAASATEKVTSAPIAIQNRSKLVALFTIPLAPPAGASSTPAQPNSGDNALSATAQTASQTASVQLLLDQHGYQAQITGVAAIERLRELAYGFGWHSSPAADGFHGGSADFSFASQGAWIADANGDLSLQEGDVAPSPDRSANASGIASAPQTQLTLHHMEWQVNYLSHPVRFAQATVQRAGSEFQFAGEFTYGPAGAAIQPASGAASGPASVRDGAKDSAKDTLRGNVAVSMDMGCVASDTEAGQGQGINSAANACMPKIQLHFGSLDAAVAEAALEKVSAEKSVFAPLTDRIRSSDQPRMPEVFASVQADSLVLGPVTLQKPAIHLHSFGNAIKIVDWEAQLLGGAARGTGQFSWDSGKPTYEILADFVQLNGTSAGVLLDGHDSRWAGGTMDGGGKVTLSGLIPKDLAASALGNLRFDWRRGSVAAAGDAPPGEVRFDRWVGVATIALGKIRLDNNSMTSGRSSFDAEGSIPFGGPAKLTLHAVTNSENSAHFKPVKTDEKGQDAPNATKP